MYVLLVDVNKSIPIVFQYHHICRSDTQRFCFHDDSYVCICQLDHYRAECFNHNTQLDHCNYCLSGGKCLQGDPNDRNDFICLCLPSYYGSRCEFSSEQFNITTSSFSSIATTKSSVADALKVAKITYMPIILLIFVTDFLNDFYFFGYI